MNVPVPYQELPGRWKGTILEPLSGDLVSVSREVHHARRHGLTNLWMEILQDMPDQPTTEAIFTAPVVSIGGIAQITDKDREAIRGLLLQLHPWRKGPFEIFGVSIDAEWRSDLKWARVEQKIGNLKGCNVLDAGYGNGYYMFRMLGAGAKLVLGIDPSQLFVAQFQALHHFYPDPRLSMLPLRMEEFPIASLETGLDVVFSMGILYHRRDVFGHLDELRQCLVPGGRLVLETLVLDEAASRELVPDKSYAKMPNVHCVPTTTRLVEWLNKSGFSDVQVLDITPTTPQEQRSTQWMTFESLSDFLDPADNRLTIEGYPAPVRAVVMARR